MEVTFLDGTAVEVALKSLIAKHDQLHWAVAWGTRNSLTAKLLKNSDKFTAVTFGLAFAQTDPELVRELVGLKGCYVVTRFPGGTYHPKIYAFRSGMQVAAIVGSANFTRGGLGKNHEAAILITGTADDPVLADILAFTAQSAKLGEVVTDDIALRYSIGHKLANLKARPPRDPIIDVSRASVKRFSSPLISMDWKQYISAVWSSNYHDIDESLKLLRTAQTWFSSEKAFHDLSSSERKAIAGIIGGTEKKANSQLDQNWGWFGTMRAMGDFMNRVSENDTFLSGAIDSIPQKGEVNKKHYERFAKLFVKAFDKSARVGGVPTASRLLAMKRPDVFLCISSTNISAAAKHMDFPKTKLTLDRYWGSVVEVIRASEWYNVDKPNNDDRQIWECRAAMLDAIYYEPN